MKEQKELPLDAYSSTAICMEAEEEADQLRKAITKKTIDEVVLEIIAEETSRERRLILL